MILFGKHDGAKEVAALVYVKVLSQHSHSQAEKSGQILG
jgi:hypothetical protein